MASLSEVDTQENRKLMEASQLYYAFTPDLIADRRRCAMTCDRFNRAGGSTRRELAVMIKKLVEWNMPIPQAEIRWAGVKTQYVLMECAGANFFFCMRLVAFWLTRLNSRRLLHPRQRTRNFWGRSLGLRRQ